MRTLRYEQLVLLDNQNRLWFEVAEYEAGVRYARRCVFDELEAEGVLDLKLFLGLAEEKVAALQVLVEEAAAQRRAATAVEA
jgi:hypothetical protein